MKYIASCSFGKDSLAMVLKLLELNYPLDEVVFFDMGIEFEAIYNNKSKLTPILESRGIIFTKLEPKETFMYYALEKPIKAQDGTNKQGYKWCGGCARWGTTLKLQAINENNKKHKDETIIEYIGVAADERNRINRERQKNICKLYPLVEWEMKEMDCLNYCYSHDWNWKQDGYELYEILDRVSCKYCKNKNLKELRNIYHYMPNIWSELLKLQSKIDMPFNDNKTLFEIEARFKNEDAQISLF